jgi:hypothetical protein
MNPGMDFSIHSTEFAHVSRHVGWTWIVHRVNCSQRTAVNSRVNSVANGIYVWNSKRCVHRTGLSHFSTRSSPVLATPAGLNRIML